MLATVLCKIFDFKDYHDKINLLSENEEIYISHLGQMEANTVWQQSYLGHRFVIRSIEKNEILSELTLQHNCIHSLGSRPSMLTNRTDDIPSRVEYS